jgi:hypothetical protein
MNLDEIWWSEERAIESKGKCHKTKGSVTFSVEMA